MKLSSYLLLFLLNLGTVFSQSDVDTLQANRIILIADSLRNAGNYKEAVSTYTKAAEVFEKLQVADQLARSYNGISESSWRLGDRTTGEQMALKAVETCNDYLDARHPEMANAYFNLGIIYMQRGDMAGAKRYQNEALAIRLEKFGNNNSITAKSYNILGVISNLEHQLDSALYYYKKALEVGLAVHGENDASIGNYYDNIGIIYNRKGDLNQSLIHKQKALDVRKRALPENHPSIASSYHNIGVEYEIRSNFEFASDYYKRALKIREAILDKTHPYLASSYRAISRMEMASGNLEQALEYSFKSTDITIQNFGASHSEVGASHTTTADILRKKNEEKRALEYFQKGLAIEEELFGKNSINSTPYLRNIAYSHWKLGEHGQALKYCKKALQIFRKENMLETERASNIYIIEGLIYKSLGNYKEAISKLKKSLELAESTFGSVHNVVAWYKLELGEVYITVEDYAKGLNLIQSALMANSPGFQDSSLYKNPVIDNYIKSELMAGGLLAKAEGLENQYEKVKDLKDLTFALETYELIDQFYDHLKTERSRIEDKINALEQNRKVYEGAIRISLRLHEITSDEKYLEKSFYFAEKSRSNALSVQLSGKKARKFAGIPDSLLTVESSLKSDRAFFQSRIFELESDKENPDLVRIEWFRDQLITTNGQLDTLTQMLESDYPDYFELKYKNSTLSVSDIQTKLSEDEALLEYFIGVKNIYIFNLTQDSYAVHAMNRDSLSENDIIKFIESLDPETSLSDKEVYDQFVSSAYILHEKLLGDPLSNLPNAIKQLTIIPDDLLSSIPWDILLTEKPQTGISIDYKNLDYLFQKYIIDYGFSSSVLYGDRDEKDGNGSILAFASSYDELSVDSYTSVPSQFRSELVPLSWNVSEVKKITEHISGTVYTGKEASERVFKENAEQYDILHLAMHAFVDHQDPTRSRLMFTSTSDSTEDDMLHAFELFDMDISARMVVLSACETGIGEFKEGEGVMSLGNAFAYAGAPSIVMSHWNVDDQSTSQLMDLFYKGLSEGKAKDVALRDARIKFLESSTDITQKPIYWGSFVLVGKDEPLSGSNSFMLYFLLVVGVVFIAVVARKRMKK